MYCEDCDKRSSCKKICDAVKKLLPTDFTGQIKRLSLHGNIEDDVKSDGQAIDDVKRYARKISEDTLYHRERLTYHEAERRKRERRKRKHKRKYHLLGRYRERCLSTYKRWRRENKGFIGTDKCITRPRKVSIYGRPLGRPKGVHSLRGKDLTPRNREGYFERWRRERILRNLACS